MSASSLETSPLKSSLIMAKLPSSVINSVDEAKHLFPLPTDTVVPQFLYKPPYLLMHYVGWLQYMPVHYVAMCINFVTQDYPVK